MREELRAVDRKYTVNGGGLFNIFKESDVDSYLNKSNSICDENGL